MFRIVSVHLQEQTFYKLYVVFGMCGYVWLLCCYRNTTATRIRIYQIRCTANTVAPEDGLTQSETCTASNWKIKSNHKNFVYLVGLYTYCKMMHGSHNIKEKISPSAGNRMQIDLELFHNQLPSDDTHHIIREWQMLITCQYQIFYILKNNPKRMIEVLVAHIVTTAT